MKQKKKTKKYATLVPVFSYWHNQVPLKPRSNKQYKVAFKIRLSTKSCSLGHLPLREALYDFC